MTAKLHSRILAALLLSIPLLGWARQRWIGTGVRVLPWTESQPACRVRLGVRDEGMYRVTASEIAAAAGVATNDVLAALATGVVALHTQGRAIYWTTNGVCDALLFYGTAVSDIYAPENVYWLTLASGQRMEHLEASPDPRTATNRWFMHTEPLRWAFVAPKNPLDRRSSKGTITNVLNYGTWVQGIADEEKRCVERKVVMSGYYTPNDTNVTIRAHLASYQDLMPIGADTHNCEIKVNGISCGTASWSGEQALWQTFAVPAGALTNAMPLLTVRNNGTKTVNDFMILEIELVYPRRYEANVGYLLCTGGTSGVANVSGFLASTLRVWDVTAPEQPLDLVASTWQTVDGGWQTTFLCGDAATYYAVFDENNGCFEPSVTGVRDTLWQDATEMPELAIVIPPRRWVAGFEEAAQPLADLRKAQGLAARIIDAEDIYNTFSDGLVHPEAFRRFAAAGVTNGPAQRLRYLLFAGYGGSDYKLDAFGFTGPYPNLFPLYMWSQIYTEHTAALLLPNDPLLGDVAGDAVPEVAVGRFLATNATELARMVSKTISYEGTETWKNRAIFTADTPTPGTVNDFALLAGNTASGFANTGWEIVTHYAKPGETNLRYLWNGAQGEAGAYHSLMAGAGFFYFIGHSSDKQAGGEKTETRLFGTVDLEDANWPFAPVALLLGCRLGRWTLWSVATLAHSINEAGARNPASGFAAVISPSGYMSPTDARDYSYAFGARIGAGALRLGDAWCGTFATMGHAACLRLRHMTLLGDPSLTISAVQTPRGTASQWLIAHGLTGDPAADLRDQDGDGFATWIEYQAGSSPVKAGIQMRAPGRVSAEQALLLSIELIAGYSYRILSCTNLQQGVWGALPWRAGPEDLWSDLEIPGDWPVKTVEVPFEPTEKRRFYKVVTE